MSEDFPLVFIRAPLGADGSNIRDVLVDAGLEARVVELDLDLIASAQTEHCGAVVVTLEVLSNDLTEQLVEVLKRQPPWSDLPIVLISSSTPEGSHRVSQLRDAGASITVLERPLRRHTLLESVRAALLTRSRQLEVRNLILERDELLGSLETKVTERTLELRKMVEEMEAFSYSVSHDLRSPLRSIAGYAELLQEDHPDELSPQARHAVERLARAAQRMDRLTQDLLAYTRIATGKLAMTAIDLDALARDVIEQYPDLDAVKQQIEIRGSLGWVEGHSPSLIQCFSNLMGNAFKFGRPGVPVRVELFSRRRGDRLKVFVSDNGTGIHPEDAKRIFNMFERAVAENIPGTGIGLAIVKKAAERMGGTVALEPGVSEGATFSLDLRASQSV